MSAPDVKALIGEVAARHGVTLKPDDPAFVLVTLNQLMLEQAVASLDEHALRIVAEFRQNMDRLGARAGKFFGGEVRGRFVMREVLFTYQFNVRANRDLAFEAPRVPLPAASRTLR